MKKNAIKEIKFKTNVAVLFAIIRLSSILIQISDVQEVVDIAFYKTCQFLKDPFVWNLKIRRINNNGFKRK